MKSHFVDILKEKSLSLTAVRLAVLESLHDYPHSDASRIFQNLQRRIPTATIQAVYNNLNALVDAGIIREIKPKGQVSLYETRVGDNHHHIVCRSCGNVTDADCKDYAPCLTPTNHHGYQIDEAEIVFWGTCPSCQKPKKEKRK